MSPSFYSQDELAGLGLASFGENVLTNPMVPESMSNVTGGKVSIGKHAIIASGSVALPDLSIGERNKNLLKRLEG
jgi:hypothetical protein